MIRRLADRLLAWYCHPDFYPDISGDLEELYLRNREKRPGTAGWNYLLQVIMLFRWSLLRPIGQNSLFKSTGMFRNYFKISVRNLARHRAYTFINVMGLAIGLAAFLLISQYIAFEKSYDRFHEGSAQLYRLTTDQVVDGVLGVRDAMSFHPSGKALQEEIPEALGYTVTRKFDETTFRNEEEVISEKGVLAVDSNFLDLFTYKILSGDPDRQLADPNTLVLTRSVAQKYFGHEDPVGKTIHIYSSYDRPFTVTGVIEDVPENTHYGFDILMSISTVKDRLERDGWSGYNYYTYLKFSENADMDKIERMLPELSKKYLQEETTLQFNLQPVEDIHLHSDFTFEPEQHGSYKTVQFLTIISIFILIIAWVNFVNLSTARAVDRAKEVGLRKVIGAQKRQLIFQFFLEAFLINLLGAAVALVATEALLPYFNDLVGKEIMHHVWNSPDFLLNLALFFILGTIISGFYPALVLSGFHPVTVLKGKFRNSNRGVLLRKTLVVVQFSASLILIASTFVVYRQMEFMRSRDLGMSIERVAGFPNPSTSGDRETHLSKIKAFHDELEKHPAILGAARMSNLPGGGSSDINSSSGGIKIVGLTDRLDVTTYVQAIDEMVTEVLDMKLLYGRSFMKDMASDSNAVVVNEALIERFGLKVGESLLNEKIQLGRDPENEKHHIIGIVQDVNRSTLKNAVEPTLYFNWKGPGSSIVKFSSTNLEEGLLHLRETWARFFPTEPLSMTFLDERFDRLYNEEQRFAEVFTAFAAFAILVASLGLFGLASFLAVQRTKEVGIRKVLGASVSQIISIFYKDFLVLIGVSILVGGPLVYYGMNLWLDNYAYRIAFPWPAIAVSALILMAFAFLTVGYQTYRVAILNPARTLKYE